MEKESKIGSLRRHSIAIRRETIKKRYELTSDEMAETGQLESTQLLADLMVENAVGSIPIPLAIAEGLLVDGETLDVPMATEEPSVVAAACYAARIIASGGGFITDADDPVMTAQIHIEAALPDALQRLSDRRGDIGEFFDSYLANMKKRGGGFRDVAWKINDNAGTILVHVDIDVRDAMGANLLNSAAEAAKPLLSEITGGRVVMAILTNSARFRKGRAEFALPLRKLSRASSSGVDGEECGRRIVLANRIAETDPDRAVTHNKGIMNGITALALATGNDTRGIEAAAHAWAARKGSYSSLTRYKIEDGLIKGYLEMPLPFAAVGGAIQYHPAFTMAHKVMGNPDGRRLSRIGAALGLAQNFAALLALVTTGIQHGHMKQHRRRVDQMETNSNDG